MKKIIKRDSIDVPKFDGMINAFSSLGMSGKDKHNQTTFSADIFNQLTLANWYVGSDIFKKIVNIPVEEMTREGYRLFSDDKELTSEFDDWAKQFDLDEKIEDGLKYAEVFGGCGLVLGADDSLDDPSKPFNPKQFKKLNYVVVFDRFYLTSGSAIENNASSKNFMKPKKYLLGGGANLKNNTIDASRVVRCEGVKVPMNLAQNYGYWGDTVLTATRDPIVAYITGNKSASYLLAETGRMVINISKLYEFLQMDGASENGAGTSALIARLRALEYSGSVINGLILGEGETASRAMINLSGIPEVLDRAKQRLATATGIPHTILFNESPSGLGATGNSEMTHWIEQIKRSQESKLRPILNRFVDLFFLETNKGVIPKYSIKFNPLSLPTPTEIANIQTARVNNVRGLIQDFVITPEQGLESLVDEDDLFSLDIEVDDSMSAALANAKEQATKEPVKDPTEE